MPAKTESNSKTTKNYNQLADGSGRFDDLGEDLLKLSSNEHICTIYRKEEDKIDSIMEFIKTGIVKNERCLIIVDEQSKEDIQIRIKTLENLRNLLNTSAIMFVDSENIYGMKSEFNQDKSIKILESHLESPPEDTFNGLRLIIEILPLIDKDSTFNVGMEFHSNIENLSSNKDINLFCLYNEYKFESKALLAVIVTHSKLIFNGYLCKNSLFMDPHHLRLLREDKLSETLYKKTVYEIVQREITEQRIEKKTSYIQSETLKGINDSIFLLDFAGNILEVNEAAHKTRGYTEEEMLSLNILDIMTSENRDLYASRIEELGKKGEMTFETTHFCKYGTELDVEFKTKLISYDNQQFILSVGRDITERKNSEEELKNSETLYRSIFESIGTANIIVDDDQNIIQMNSKMVDLSGYTIEETVGKKKWTELILKTELPKLLDYNRKRIENPTSAPKSYETRIRDSFGEAKNVLISIEVIPGTRRVFASLLDISEQKKLEKERESVEEQLQLIKHSLDSSLSGTAIVDLNRKIIYVNNAYLQLWGYETSEEVLGKSFEQILPYANTDISVAQKAETEFSKTGSWSGDIQSEKLDGSPLWVRMSLNRVLDSEGKPIAQMGSFLDISNEKISANSLLESEGKFRMIFNNANDAMYLYSIKDDQNPSNFIEINDIACKMLGYTEEEFRKMSPSDLTSEDTNNEFPEILSKLKTLEKLTFEGNHFTKEGERIPVEISAHTFQFNNEQMVLTIVRDISERKISEEKLSRLNEELEEKVIQRTYQMETLYNIIKDISETFDLKEAMEIIAKYISQLVDYDIIVQLMTQEELNLIQIEVPEGNKEVADEFLLTVKDKFVEINPDSSVNRDSINIITADKKKIKEISSHISIPLIAEDKVVGFIVVGSEKEDAYCEEEVWFLYKIADNISHTLQRLKVIITAKDELETVLNHTSDGIILLNNNESAVMMNDAGSRLFESIKDSKTDTINNEIMDLKELKQIGKRELALNGDTYHVSMSPIKTDFVHGWLLTAHDITEERAMQKKILHQDRLATLGKITGGIAHDFNNILASIIGAADFSLMSVDNLESREFLNLIIRQSERGASLIRQMLDFTRQTVIKPKPVSMLDFITEFSRVIRSSLPENIILSAVTEDWTVFMDQGQLQQLFMNLILNSRDALAHGGKINISVEEVNHSKIVDFEEIEIDKNQDYIHLIVNDNGEGMNEQTKNKIFEPFYTTKDPG